MPATINSANVLATSDSAAYQVLCDWPPSSNYCRAVADPENFGGGGFEAQNLKNSDVFTKIETDFSVEVGNSNVFFAQIQVVSKKKKKKKKKGLHQN